MTRFLLLCSLDQPVLSELWERVSRGELLVVYKVDSKGGAIFILQIIPRFHHLYIFSPLEAAKFGSIQISMSQARFV